MSKSERRARKALQHHTSGDFCRSYDACFEMGDGAAVARLFWEIAEAEGRSVNPRYAPAKPATAQAPLFDMPKAAAQEVLF